MKEGFSQEYDDLMKKIKAVEASVDTGMKKIKIPRVHIAGTMKTQTGIPLWGWYKQLIKDGRTVSTNGKPHYVNEKDKLIKMVWGRKNSTRFWEWYDPNAHGWIISTRAHGRAWMNEQRPGTFPKKNGWFYGRKWHTGPPRHGNWNAKRVDGAYHWGGNLHPTHHQWVDEYVPGEDMDVFPQTKYYPNPRPVTDYYVVNDSKKSHQQKYWMGTCSDKQ